MKKSLFLVFNFLFLMLNLSAKEIQLADLLTAVKNHPEIKKSALQVQKAENNFSKINGEFGPKITILSGLGPSKKTTGNALSSTHSKSVDTATFLGSVDLKWPLFQFNRAGDLKDANKNLVQIKEIESRKKTLELEKNSKEYYYGYQYAYTLLDFTKEVEVDVKKALETMEKNKNRENDQILKLKIFLALISAKKAEIEAGLNKAELGIKDILQVSGEEKITLSEPWLSFNQDSFKELEVWRKIFQTNNPELQMGEKALYARSSFQSAEEKAKLPMVGIFSKYDWMKTPGSTKQDSKFSYDPYHKNDFSIGLGLLWEFDFGKTHSLIKDASLETELARIDRHRAEAGLPLLLEKNYYEYEEAFKKARSLREAYKDSKKLLTRFQTEAAFGMNQSGNFIKDYVEAYTLRASVFKDYQEAVYHFELKKAELLSFVGVSE